MFWEDVTPARNSSTQAVVILMNDILLYVKNVSWSLSPLPVHASSNYILFQDPTRKEKLSDEPQNYFCFGGAERRVEWQWKIFPVFCLLSVT